MLHYMYEHFIDKFEWFARADDDVFMRTDKLEKFLRSIDSSKPQFIGKYLLFIRDEFKINGSLLIIHKKGQAGRGNNEEFGLLSLEFDENFCMGGPGVIMSRETLRRGKDPFLVLFRNDCKCFVLSGPSHINVPQKPVQHT